MLIYIPENLRNSGGNATPYDDSALKAEIAELKEKVAVLEKFHSVAPSDDDTRALYGIKAVGFSYFDTGITLDTANVGYMAVGYVDGEKPGTLIGAYESNTLRDRVDFMAKSRKIQVKMPNNKEYSAGAIDLNAPMSVTKVAGADYVNIGNEGGEIFDFATNLSAVSDSEATYQILPRIISVGENHAVFMKGEIEQNGVRLGLFPVKIKGEICLLKAGSEAQRDEILADIKANGFDALKYGDKFLRGAGEATFAEVVAPSGE